MCATRSPWRPSGPTAGIGMGRVGPLVADVGHPTRWRRAGRCRATSWSRRRQLSIPAGSPSTRRPRPSGHGWSRWGSTVPAGTAMTGSICAGRALETIVPKLQDLAVGDLMPMSPGGGFEVKVLEPRRALVLFADTALIERQACERRPRPGGRPAGLAALSGAFLRHDPASIHGELGVLARATRRRPDAVDRAVPGALRVGRTRLPAHRAGHGVRRLRDDAAPDARDPRAGAADARWLRRCPTVSRYDHTPRGQWSGGRVAGHERRSLHQRLRPADRLRGPDAVGLSPMATDIEPPHPARPSARWPSASARCRRRASAGSSTSWPPWTTSSAWGWGSPTSTRRGSSSRPASRACARAGPTTPATSGRSSCGGRSARHLEGRYGVAYDPATEILITVGASEAVDLALRATCDPGDEVILHEPSYVAYVPAIVFAGGVGPSRRDALRGRLRARSGRGRGRHHAAHQGALPRLSRATRPAPSCPTTSRTSWPTSPSATTCSSTATRSTTGSPTAPIATGR